MYGDSRSHTLTPKGFREKRTRDQKDMYDRIALMEHKINMILELLDKLEILKDGRPTNRS